MPTYRVGTSVFAVQVIGRQVSGGAANVLNSVSGAHGSNVGLLDQYVPQPPFVVPVEEPAASGDASISDGDTGVGTDSVAQAQTVTDAGSGADTAAVRVVVADTGAGLDAVTQRQTLIDTGAGVDASTLAVALALTDTAAGADDGNKVAEDVLVSAWDQGGEAGRYGGDDTYGGGIYGATIDTASVTVVASDTGVGVDATSLYDGVATQVVVGDTATSIEFIGPIPMAVGDTAAGTDASVIGLRVFEAYGPYGTGTYGSGTYAADASAVDSASVSAITPVAPTGDSAQGSDAGTLAAATASADTGVGSDAATVAVAVPVADTGAALEAVTANAALALSDLAAAVDDIFVGLSDTDEGFGLDTEIVTDVVVPTAYVISFTSSISVVPFTGSISVAPSSTSVLVAAFSGEIT